MNFPERRVHLMNKEQLHRRLAAIFATDVVWSCRLIGKDEEGAVAQLKDIRKKLFEPRIAHHRGRIVKNTGDGALEHIPLTYTHTPHVRRNFHIVGD
jgi:class 3 adenylate cyclase